MNNSIYQSPFYILNKTQCKHVKCHSLEAFSFAEPEHNWNPHKVELTLWAHFVASELEPSLLTDLPPAEDVPQTSDNESPDKDKEHTEEKEVEQAPPPEEDSADSFANLSSGEVSNDVPEHSFSNSEQDRNDNGLEPPAKKCRI